jgi:hypothetical protein
MAKNITDMMINKLMENYEAVGDEMLDVDTDNLHWQVLRPLRYIREIARKTLTGDREDMDI